MAEENGPRPEGAQPASKTDEDIGRAVMAASHALNDALREASRAKLEVEITVNDQAEPGLVRKSVIVRVWRRVIVA